MKISPVYSDYRSESIRGLQWQAKVTEDADVQLRIAEKSNHVGVLLALTTNKNLVDEAVQTLFDRDISRVSKQLQAAGYEQDSFFARIF